MFRSVAMEAAAWRRQWPSGGGVNSGGDEVLQEDWRARAEQRLPRFVFDYIDGGADRELVLKRNRAAIQRILLLPEALNGVERPDVEATLFGARLSCPLVIAPTGLNGLLWPKGDIELAHAAQSAAIPFVLSTAATSSLERVAQSAGGQRWFQLYVLEDRRFTERLLHRARAAGYQVLVVTVDVPVSGNRLRDLRNGFNYPFRIRPAHVLDAIAHPRWTLQMLRAGVPRLENLDCHDASNERARSALLARRMDQGLSWRCIEWLRTLWHGPIVLKGILNPRDAQRACDCGVEGIVVSNHGGRQLDIVPATMEVLGLVIDAVGSRLVVMVDGGFREGGDVLKALVLGAKAVWIGRSVLYGLAAAGRSGALAVIENLRSQLQRTMVLSGYPSLASLSREKLIFRVDELHATPSQQ